MTADDGYRDKNSYVDRFKKLRVVEAADTGLDSCNRNELGETSVSSGIESSRR